MFGPTNIGVWRVSIAVEQGEGGNAAELAKSMDPRAIRKSSRQTTYWIDLGRGLAQERQDREAIDAFLHAERIGPELVHRSPMVRESTRAILYRASRSAGGPALRGLAQRVGAIPA